MNNNNTRPATTEDFVQLSLNLNWRERAAEYERAMFIHDAELNGTELNND